MPEVKKSLDKRGIATSALHRSLCLSGHVSSLSPQPISDLYNALKCLCEVQANWVSGANVDFEPPSGQQAFTDIMAQHP